MRKRMTKKASGILKWGSVAAFALVLFAVFGDQGFLKLNQMTQTEQRLVQMRDEIGSENSRLTQEIEQLKEPQYLEKVAREELGLLRPDEVVYYVGERP